MKIMCDIIKDLMPSYIDDICSEDSKKIIEEHINTCSYCSELLKNMKQPVDYGNELTGELAENPLKKIKKKHRNHMMITILLSFVCMGIMISIIQNVGFIHDIFFYQEFSTISTEEYEDQWTQISFENSNYLKFDSLFCKKRVTNHALNRGSVCIQILDLQGNCIVESKELFPGESLDLKELHRNTDYIVEVKALADRYLLVFS